MGGILTELKACRPLIHCIVGAVGANFCANGALALGARPIMAEHPLEVREITSSAAALLLNLSGITEQKMQAMYGAAAAAKKKGIPIVLDAVGAACSPLRRSFALELASDASVIKGNYSEIYALYNGRYTSSGVDSTLPAGGGEIRTAAADLARRYRATVLASGKTDIITDGTRITHIGNGVEQLTRVTATGCLLGTVCACFAAGSQPMTAAVYACAVLGICGETAETPKGSGSFMYGLLDALSRITDSTVLHNIKREDGYIENV